MEALIYNHCVDAQHNIRSRTELFYQTFEQSIESLDSNASSSNHRVDDNSIREVWNDYVSTEHVDGFIAKHNNQGAMEHIMNYLGELAKAECRYLLSEPSEQIIRKEKRNDVIGYALISLTHLFSKLYNNKYKVGDQELERKFKIYLEHVHINWNKMFSANLKSKRLFTDQVVWTNMFISKFVTHCNDSNCRFVLFDIWEEVAYKFKPKVSLEMITRLYERKNGWDNSKIPPATRTTESLKTGYAYNQVCREYFNEYFNTLKHGSGTEEILNYCERPIVNATKYLHQDLIAEEAWLVIISKINEITNDTGKNQEEREILNKYLTRFNNLVSDQNILTHFLTICENSSNHQHKNICKSICDAFVALFSTNDFSTNDFSTNDNMSTGHLTPRLTPQELYAQLVNYPSPHVNNSVHPLMEMYADITYRVRDNLLKYRLSETVRKRFESTDENCTVFTTLVNDGNLSASDISASERYQFIEPCSDADSKPESCQDSGRQYVVDLHESIMTADFYGVPIRLSLTQYGLIQRFFHVQDTSQYSSSNYSSSNYSASNYSASEYRALYECVQSLFPPNSPSRRTLLLERTNTNYERLEQLLNLRAPVKEEVDDSLKARDYCPKLHKTLSKCYIIKTVKPMNGEAMAFDELYWKVCDKMKIWPNGLENTTYNYVLGEVQNLAKLRHLSLNTTEDEEGNETTMVTYLP